jgi:GNAT superfamily N-acetyltransferase
MTDLIARPFSLEDLAITRDFYCGDAAWERPIAEWIRGTDGVVPKMITLIEKGKTEVWLYQLASGELVGYSALTKHRWKIGEEWKNVTLLQAFGIQKQFQGKPDGVGETRYSKQMLADVTSRAISYGCPLWGLLVHKENIKAQRLYESIGFIRIDEARDIYYRMFLDLSELVKQ